jgi:PIN domain nuclease of toxin-antitoxin system
MKLLLDTNIIIWFANGDNSLNEKIKNLISDPQNEKFCSLISIWEIAIKININKLAFNLPFLQFKLLLSDNNINLLHPGFEEFSFYRTMPLYHKDPFDRLLIAQAIVNSYSIITSDKVFTEYPASVILH